MKKKKWLHLLKIKVVGILALLTLAILLLQTPWVQKIVLKKITANLEEVTQSQIHVQSASGFIPFSFDLYDISWTQNGHTWLFVKKLSLKRSLLLLFFKKKKVLDLFLKDIEFSAQPVIKSNSQNKDPLWPNLPLSKLRVKVQFSNLNITKNTFSKEIPQKLFGKVDMNWRGFGKVYTIKSSLASKDLAKTHINLSARAYKPKRQLSLSVKLSDTQSNLSAFYDISPRLITEFHLDVSGKSSAFWALFNPEYDTKNIFRGRTYIALNPKNSQEGWYSDLLENKPLIAQAEFRFNANEGLIFDDTHLENENVHFNGQFTLDRNYNFYNSFLEGEVLSLVFTKPFLKKTPVGSIKSLLNFSGFFTNPVIAGELSSSALIFEKGVLKNSSLQFEISKDSNARFVGQAQGKSDLNQLNLSASSEFEGQNFNAITFKNLKVKYGENYIESASLMKKNAEFIGTLNLNLPKLQHFSPFYNQEIQGSLSGALSLDQKISSLGVSQEYTLDLKNSELAFLGYAFNDFQISSSGNFKWETIKEIESEGTFFCNEIFIQKMKYEQIHGYGKYQNQSLDYKLQTKGELSFLSSGQFDFSQSTKKWLLREFFGNLIGNSFNLISPVQIEYRKDFLEFSPILIKIFEGQIYSTFEPKTSALELKLTNFPLEVVTFFYPRFDLDGIVDLQAKLSPINSWTSGTFQAIVKDVGLHHQNNDELYEMQLNAQLSPQSLNLDLAFESSGRKVFSSSGTLPISLRPYPPKIDVSFSKKANLNWVYEGKMIPALSLLWPQNHLIDGFIDSKGRVEGPLAHPQVEGHLNVYDGYYENLFLGLVLDNITLSSKSEQDRLNITQFSAQDGEEGKVYAKGSVQLDLKKSLPFAFKVDFNQAKVIQFDFLSAAFLGDVVFKGNIKKSLLLGKLDVSFAEVNIPERIGKGLPELNVSYLYPNEDRLCSNPPSSNTVKLPIDFDVTLKFSKDAYILGRGLNSTWRGVVDVKGNEKKPLFYGLLKSQDGTFNFAGRYFQLSAGSIQFNGHLAQNTSINLTASEVIDSYNVIANLKGPILAPYLTFRSEPSLSQRDIVSLALFGQKVDALTPFQGLSLTYTLASLSGVYEGPDVIDRIRRGIGLDQLSISTLLDQNKDYTSVQVGKYITRGILITLNRPISADPAPFIITAYFRGGFQFQTYFDQQQISKLLLQWSLNY